MPNGAGQLSFEEAREYLGCSPYWLQQRMKRGEVAYVKIGRSRWFEQDDLDAARARLGRREASSFVPLGRRRRAV